MYPAVFWVLFRQTRWDCLAFAIDDFTVKHNVISVLIKASTSARRSQRSEPRLTKPETEKFQDSLATKVIRSGLRKDHMKTSRAPFLPDMTVFWGRMKQMAKRHWKRSYTCHWRNGVCNGGCLGDMELWIRNGRNKEYTKHGSPLSSSKYLRVWRSVLRSPISIGIIFRFLQFSATREGNQIPHILLQQCFYCTKLPPSAKIFFPIVTLSLGNFQPFWKKNFIED